MSGALWRRLDTPGHDACRLEPADGGWRLDGTAVFLHEGGPARLDYHVTCDRGWRTERGHIQGFIGARAFDWRIVREPGGTWSVNGAAVPGLETCVDLDVGFTPATNLTLMRRVALAPGQAAEVELPQFPSGVVPLTISVETGFYPRDIDPNSTDRRFLGIWVEVKPASAEAGAGKP